MLKCNPSLLLPSLPAFPSIDVGLVPFRNHGSLSAVCKRSPFMVIEQTQPRDTFACAAYQDHCRFQLHWDCWHLAACHIDFVVRFVLFPSQQHEALRLPQLLKGDKMLTQDILEGGGQSLCQLPRRSLSCACRACPRNASEFQSEEQEQTFEGHVAIACSSSSDCEPCS